MVFSGALPVCLHLQKKREFSQSKILSIQEELNIGLFYPMDISVGGHDFEPLNHAFQGELTGSFIAVVIDNSNVGAIVGADLRVCPCESI
jgi:hypothetical protein